MKEADVRLESDSSISLFGVRVSNRASDYGSLGVSKGGYQVSPILLSKHDTDECVLSRGSVHLVPTWLMDLSLSVGSGNQ